MIGDHPCPFRILDDTGSAFLLGCIGGSAWHFVKGLKNAPKHSRMRSAFHAIMTRAPVLGNFGVWGLLFSTCECTLSTIRHKEDTWNAIISGATTGGLLAIRAGFKAFIFNAIIGGILMAAIEGAMIYMGRTITRMQYKSINAQLFGTATLEPPTIDYNDKIDDNFSPDKSNLLPQSSSF